MSDKTKYYRDLALIERRYKESQARDALKPAPEPMICRCGHSIFERELFKIYPEVGKPSIRCANCLPPGYRWALW